MSKAKTPRNLQGDKLSIPHSIYVSLSKLYRWEDRLWFSDDPEARDISCEIRSILRDFEWQQEPKGLPHDQD